MAWDTLIFWELPLLFLSIPSFYQTVYGLPVWTAHFFGLQGKPYHVSFKYHRAFAFKVQLPVPSSQMMDFVFLLPKGQWSRQFGIYQCSVTISSLLPDCPFSPVLPRPVPWPSIRPDDSGSLCVLISLKKWKVKCLKAGQLWPVLRHQGWLFVFLAFSQKSLCQKTFALLLMQSPNYKNTQQK